jgi:subtilisin family serine protease
MLRCLTVPVDLEVPLSERPRAVLAAIIAISILVPAISVPAMPAAASPTARAVPDAVGSARAVPGRLVVVYGSRGAAVEARSVHAELGADVVERIASPLTHVVRLPAGRSVDAAIRRYERLPGVVSAEQDRIAIPFGALPSDPLFPHQWGLHNTRQPHRLTDVGLSKTNGRGRNDADVDAPEAWATTTGDPGVVIAVIDTGVKITHPGIAPNLWVNPGEVPDNGVDDDANGYVDDVHGYDFENDDGNPSPDGGLQNAHGTHVAGIAAAAQDAVGITGICPGCRIMALRFDFTVGQEVEAIGYAVANGADIINMSFGSPIFSKAERAAIEAAGAAGVLTVAAAGNSSADNDVAAAFSDGDFAPSFPASLSLGTIISVAASNDRDQYGYHSQCRGSVPLWRCAWSSWGHDSVDLAAPGADIVSSVTGGGGGPGGAGYDTWDGTSMAAPMVAGIAGLVKAANPGFSALEIKNAIMNGVDRVDLALFNFHADATGTGRGPLTGAFTRTSGRANAAGALTAPTSNATPLTDGNIDGAVRAGRRERGRVTWPRDVNDVFRKRLQRGVRYEITLRGPRDRDLDLLVWNPGTLEIFQFTFGCFRPKGSCPALAAASASPDANERVRLRARTTGRYYLHVTGWYSSGRYTLTVRRI